MAHPTSINPPPHEQGHNLVTLCVPIGRRYCAACVQLVERRLSENAPVKRVSVDAVEGVAQVEADADTVSIEELSELAGECCGGRSPVALPDAAVSSHRHVYSAKIKDEENTAGEAEHSGMAHAGQDMSDPGMAAAMEADIRRRFWISLVLAIPVLAYSSLGMLLLGGPALPTPFGVPSDWIMLAFATPIALWTSSVFHISAYYALKSRVRNMSVLISPTGARTWLNVRESRAVSPGQLAISHSGGKETQPAVS